MVLTSDDTDRNALAGMLTPILALNEVKQAREKLKAKAADKTATKETVAPKVAKDKAAPLGELLKEIPDGEVQLVKGPLYLLKHLTPELRRPIVSGLVPEDWLDKAALKASMTAGADKALMQEIVAYAGDAVPIRGAALDMAGDHEKKQDRVQEIIGSHLYKQFVKQVMGTQNKFGPDEALSKALIKIAVAINKAS